MVEWLLQFFLILFTQPFMKLPSLTLTVGHSYCQNLPLRQRFIPWLKPTFSAERNPTRANVFQFNEAVNSHSKFWAWVSFAWLLMSWICSWPCVQFCGCPATLKYCSIFVRISKYSQQSVYLLLIPINLWIYFQIYLFLFGSRWLSHLYRHCLPDLKNLWEERWNNFLAISFHLLLF